MLFLNVYVFFVCLICIVYSSDYFEVKAHCSELLALLFEMFFDMSQTLASIEQPSRIFNHGEVTFKIY